MGLDGAAKQIDLRFLRLIDAWAQNEAPAWQISVLDGLETLPAEPNSKAAKPQDTTPTRARKHFGQVQLREFREVEFSVLRLTHTVEPGPKCHRLVNLIPDRRVAWRMQGSRNPSRAGVGKKLAVFS